MNDPEERIYPDDFVMLGKAVPEPHLDTMRVEVCSAGVSARYGMVRINPLPILRAPAVWERCEVPLVRNPKDWRRESWCVASGSLPYEQSNRRFTVRGKVNSPAERRALLEPHYVESIQEANRRKLSLALLPPEAYKIDEIWWKANDKYAPPIELFSGDLRYKTSSPERFPLHPRLKFVDGGGPHDLRIRAWGAFEFIRRYGQVRAEQQLVGSLHLDRPRTLFVGNMVGHPNAWLIISVLAPPG